MKLNKYAIMCSESYDEPNTGETIGDEKVLRVFNEYGIWACYTDNGTVVVRGSDTTDGNWEMWIRNLFAFDLFRADNLHDGWFNAAWKINEWIHTNNFKPKLVIGHSAGGSIGGCLKYMVRFYSDIDLVTFGAPEYRRGDNTPPYLKNITNVHVEHDFTRKTILHKLGYRRPGMSIILRHKKCLQIPILRGILDHRPSVYVKLTERM